MKVFEIKNIVKIYNMNSTVLKNLDIEVEAGEFLSIMGKSGSGKSTLLKIFGTLEVPTSGSVKIDGVALDYKKNSILSELRRKKIGFIFQDFYLVHNLTAIENIILPMLLDKKDYLQAKEKGEELLKNFDLEYLRDKYPTEMSGGEKQRIAICRALSNGPEVILADEPTGNLDSNSSKEVIQAFIKLNKIYGKTLIMVTHDPLMASLSKRVLFLKDGQIEEDISLISGTQKEYYEKIQKINKEKETDFLDHLIQ